MPSACYPLEDGGPERLEITWETSGQDGWKNIVARLDGQEIGTVTGKKELEAGQTLFLPEGSVLGVQLLGAPYEAGLRVVLDGRPLPGSVGEMAESARLAKEFDAVFWMPLFYGALNVGMGLLSVFAPSDFLEHVVRSYGLNPVLIVFGLAQLGLVFPIRRRSVWALVTVAALTVIEGIVGGYLVGQSAYLYYHDTKIGITGVVVQVIARVMMLNVIPLSVMVRGMILLLRLKRWQPSTI